MRLAKAKVSKYRSIRETEEFEIEPDKTILVGANEAGKTAILQALQQINAPEGVSGFKALRDYPRALYNDITTGKVNPSTVDVVVATFELDDDDRKAIGEEYNDCTYQFTRRLDNSYRHNLLGIDIPTVKTIEKDLRRMAAHCDKQFEASDDEPDKPSERLEALISSRTTNYYLQSDVAKEYRAWMTSITALVDEENSTEENRFDRLNLAIDTSKRRLAALTILKERIPVFVLFSNYFRVRPLLHLEHLAKRIETNVLDDEAYDYGNLCLLKLLGFTAKKLSELGSATAPNASDADAFQEYRDQLDQRSYQLNAASVRLTKEIRSIWQPDPDRPEADKLKVTADGQYLKVVVEDDLGVDIELDQRSEGFQWLVSFFVVFFAEAADEYENAILLLDEPGLSLHGLKQREFRHTLSRLAESNQVLYSTHSPFLVGPDELDIVRVVEMEDRDTGTKVHTQVTADDPASMLPLQEALGYDLAQSLFTQSRNLILEGLTDYWYIDAMSELLRSEGIVNLNQKIALVPANSAGKVVYFATILHANKLKVAALLDSDAAGDQAAQQDVLVHRLGNKNILRTKDAYDGPVKAPEVEDLLRDTLVTVAHDTFGCDVTAVANDQQSRDIVGLLEHEASGFSKYKLAKAFLRWSRSAQVSDFQTHEIEAWKRLIESINKALK